MVRSNNRGLQVGMVRNVALYIITHIQTIAHFQAMVRCSETQVFEASNKGLGWPETGF